ncbi:MAG: DUF177 domain-containing protein [Nitrosomonadales bacterium]|nr:DUF177 domain-containing protein [Nitrosomonadales bacterium]
MFARPFIDSLDFALNGKELRGEIPVTEMPRLQDMLATPVGRVSYVVQGFTGGDGKPMLDLMLEGSCQLRCQRCLEVMDFPFMQHTSLRLQEGELDEFAVEEDEIDSIAASRRLDVLGLLEEEILLALPFAPKHPEGECKSALEGLNSADQNPFAVLAGLKSS